jgi:hypothetical protein
VYSLSQACSIPATSIEKKEKEERKTFAFAARSYPPCFGQPRSLALAGTRERGEASLVRKKEKTKSASAPLFLSCSLEQRENELKKKK